MAKHSIVLLSGGIDSTACVHYYLQNQFAVTSLFIDYGQGARKDELSSATRISKYYGIALDVVTIDFQDHFGPGEILGRNALLLFAAIMKYPKYTGLISLGIHSGTNYYDCSESFIEDIMRVIAGYSNGNIQVDAPFLKFDKGAVYHYAIMNKLPIDLTYSCEKGGTPCQACNSCMDRRRLNVRSLQKN